MSFLDQLFANLTKPGVTVNGQTTYNSDPSQLASMASQHIPSAAAIAGPDVMKVQDPSNVNLPSQIEKPSFKEASHNKQGMPDATGAGLNKAGKLLTVLFSGLQGAAAGAGQRTFGEGFQSGGQLPFIQAYQRQQVEHGNLQNQMLQNQVQYAPLLQRLGLIKSQVEIGKDAATTAKTNAETANLPIDAALKQAQAEAANYKDDPNLGLIDLRTKLPVNPSGTAPLTAAEAAVLGKQPGERVPLKIKNTANEIVSRGWTTLNTEEGVYSKNRNTGEKIREGNNPRNIFAPENKIVPAAMDPNNPGNLTYTKAGTAMAQGAQAPGSAPVQASKKTLESATSGPIGNESNAFQTAMAHAELLKQAAQEMQNPNSRTLAGIRNRLKTEFGDSDLTNFNAIAGAYSREVTKMLSAGHMTDAEIGAAGATLPSNANLQTLLKVIDSYKALAESKMGLRKDQVKRGMQGKPNFPETQVQGQWNPRTGRYE